MKTAEARIQAKFKGLPMAFSLLVAIIGSVIVLYILYISTLDGFSIIVFLLIGIVCWLPFIIGSMTASRINKCSLYATEHAVVADVFKALGSEINLDLPFESISAISIVNNSSTSSMFGGDIITISSSSGITKIPCVQNANEFRDSVLERIKQYKASSSTPNTSNIIQPASNADELLKFKQLLDQGIISQEEFDNKKRELLK